MTNIGNNVFSECTSLAKVTIADSETALSLGYDYYSSPIFSSCPLDYVYIGRDISYQTSSKYGYSPFYRNTTLREVKIADEETDISVNEFYGCTNLQTVTIGDGVTTIGKWAFSGCSSLKYFTFGSKLENIGQEAFSDCTALIEISSKAQLLQNVATRLWMTLISGSANSMCQMVVLLHIRAQTNGRNSSSWKKERELLMPYQTYIPEKCRLFAMMEEFNSQG